MPSSQEERRRSEEEDGHVKRQNSTNLTVPAPAWHAQAHAPRPKSSPTNLPQNHTYTPIHTHSRSDGEVPVPPQTHSRPGSATEPSWQPEPPRSLWERPRFLAEDGGDRDREVRFEGGSGERKSKEEIEREREVRRRSIRVDSYDDRVKRDDEGCCGCTVM
jgi:hypothetical protein